MTNEIKEILDNLKYTAKKHTIQVLENGEKIEHCPQVIATEMRLNSYSANILLDYITNLQEENERLKEENKHIFANVNDDELLISNAMNYAEAQDYKQRIDKAIKYIKKNIPYWEEWYYDMVIGTEDMNKIIDILRGDE